MHAPRDEPIRIRARLSGVPKSVRERNPALAAGFSVGASAAAEAAIHLRLSYGTA
jgi:hypothetical protein